MNSKSILSIAIVTMTCFSIPVNAAESRCAQRQGVSEVLLARYGETPAFVALSKERLMWEWYTNRETGTWTLFLTEPSGKTCFIDSGDNWRTLAPESPGMED